MRSWQHVAFWLLVLTSCVSVTTPSLLALKRKLLFGSRGGGNGYNGNSGGYHSGGYNERNGYHRASEGGGYINGGDSTIRLFVDYPAYSGYHGVGGGNNGGGGGYHEGAPHQVGGGWGDGHSYAISSASSWASGGGGTGAYASANAYAGSW
ncbi:dormancy-associated protein 2-like [Drosophila teissieri]|uniref:dormancy-associated protein 2-like n=1 Tax=Drosophila teissieri TaxID=7243 RepID=UPI001CB9FCD3|nr:dormancy-associated protein 2-like [Drosophila teissieri]